SIPGRRAFAPAAAVQNRSIRFCRTLVDEGRESLGRANRARRRRGVVGAPRGICAYSIPGRRAFAPAIAVQNRSIRFCRTLVDEGRESLRRANRARRRRGVLALPEGFEPSSQP